MRRAYAGLFLALWGCDPTAGLADSADAAVPELKRYFDGRGSQLSDGPWNRVVVDLDPETLYHVGARRLDDEQPTFHLFGNDAREGCEVTPNAGTWLMGKPEPAPFRLLPFVESLDERGHGRMRFTGLDCTVQDLVVEDAGRPYPRLYDHGYLVPTKRGYTFADPWLGQQREIAASVQAVLVWDNAVLLWADDQLLSFSDQWEKGSAWGNAPSAVVQLQNDFLVEDADGFHHVKFARDTLGITADDVLRGTCHLQQSSLISSDDEGGWLAVQQPCDNPRPTLLHLAFDTFETLDSYELPFEADARNVRALIGPAIEGEVFSVSAAYVADADESGLGTLWAWQAGRGDSIMLGEHGSVDSVFLTPPDNAWDGGAQVNFQSLGGRPIADYVNFRWDGATSTTAERVLLDNSSGELVINFDGTAGDLSRFDGNSYSVIARGIPPSSGELTSYTAERDKARVVRFDGDSGQLLLGDDGHDISSWREVGSGVPPQFVAFSWFMPALVFLEDWDPSTSSGTLVAYNYELDARSTIAEGVTSFDMTSYPFDGVVYAVPQGKQRGIWFSKAK